MTKTKKITQDEYEELYMGAELKIDERYSEIIAMLFIVMMYSSAIPVLYIAGSLICMVMYWTDKALFLNYYKLPPRYGRDLAKRAIKVMEYSILLHLLVGAYMLTNQDIFPVVKNETRSPTLFLFTETVISPVIWLFGLEPERFQSDHALLYICGIALFVTCFLLNRIFGVFFTIINWCCCMENDEVEKTWCTDIF